MGGETTTVVLVMDRGCFWAVDVEMDWAVALMAMASEDPNTWRDLELVWERHAYPAMPKQFDDLPWEAIDPEEAREALDVQNSWVWIDMVDKRLVASSLFAEWELNMVYDMTEDAEGRACWPVSLDLAPWWELVVDAEPEDVVAPREVPLEVRRTDRNFLYGRPFMEHVADCILGFVASARGSEMDQWNDETDLEDLMLDVHRKWLMTPRTDLNGAIPRTLVHGGADWIDRLGRSQARRAADQKQLYALSMEFSNVDVAPMGREEMVAYSEWCRDLILEGWRWSWNMFPRGPRVVETRHREELLAFLESQSVALLQRCQEGAPPPGLVIECSRRRIPVATSLPVQGMTWPELDGSATECDCPVCRWQADQVAGGNLNGLSMGFGESQWMELDGEFAFSMYETREEWAENQSDWGEDEEDYNDDWSDDPPTPVATQPQPQPQIKSQTESPTKSQTTWPLRPQLASQLQLQPWGPVTSRKPKDNQDEDPFAPIWSSVSSDQELPDDFAGQLGLTFLMAELVTELKSRHASADQIQELNARFAERRRLRAGGGRGARKEFCDYLEGLACQYPDMIPRLADLQSRI